MDLHVLDDNPFYLLPVPQTRIELVLAERAAELGVEVRRGHELTGLSQHADTVTVEVTGPNGRYEISGRYVAGADGAHSRPRGSAGGSRRSGYAADGAGLAGAVRGAEEAGWRR